MKLENFLYQRFTHESFNQPSFEIYSIGFFVKKNKICKYFITCFKENQFSKDMTQKHLEGEN